MILFTPPTELRLHGPCDGTRELRTPHLHFMMEWFNGPNEPNQVAVGYVSLDTMEYAIDEEFTTQANNSLVQQFEAEKIVKQLAKDTARAVVEGKLQVPPEMVEMARAILEDDADLALSPESIENLLRQEAERPKEHRGEKESRLTTGMYL